MTLQTRELELAVVRTERTRFASHWAGLLRAAGWSALAVVMLIPIQAVVYILWPPPSRVLDYFAIFQSNPVLGLLDLDVLLILDQLLIIVMLLGLYVALSRTDRSLTLIGTACGLLGAALFVVSREATVSMLFLSQQYAAAGTDADRAALVAAGQTLLTTYNGTAYSVGYVLSGLAMLIISSVMLRGRVFSRTCAVAGIAAGLTGLVPANAGLLGLALSFVSLVPLMVWLTLTGRRMLQLAGSRRA